MMQQNLMTKRFTGWLADSKPARQRWVKVTLGQSSLVHDAIPLILAILVGLVTGLGAYFFVTLLHEITTLTHSIQTQWGTLGSIGVMILAGLITGTIISRFASEAKGHGVPEVMEAIALKRGRIRPRVAIAKIIASAITIGSGGSAGREGPIVQVGSTLGSTAGQWAKLSDEQVGMLVASGAAAGIAATFNAPIAGTLFALEVILGRFTNRYIGIVVVSAVSANVISRILLGEHPAFAVPAYGLNSPVELLIYIVLGVVAALVAILFIRVLYAAEHVFDSWTMPLPIKTALGMGLTAVVAISAPEVLGPGLEFIGEAIAEEMTLTIGVMLGLLAFKLIATTFTLGAGNSGGVFAPGLFMGAMVGGIFGQLSAQLFPGIAIQPGAYALVGMAAVFAGSARAPMTAIIIVLEMSNDYRLILPLLMTVIISTLLADFLHPDSIYTRKLILRGIHLERGHDVDVLQSVQVHEVMTKDATTVTPDTKIKDLIPHFAITHSHGFPIIDTSRRLIGVVALSDIENVAHLDNFEDLTAADVGTTDNIITVYSHDPIYQALRRLNMYDVGRLPVIASDDTNEYLGLVRRANILLAYEIGLARKSVEQYQQKLPLRNVEENEFLEVVVEQEAPMVGRSLMEFPCSDDCLIVSIRRKGNAVIAHGTTKIEAGDIITAYVYPDAHDEVIKQFKALQTS
jgi:CIC family chloride channel protein